MAKAYGYQLESRDAESNKHGEELRYLGFTLVENVLDQTTVDEYRSALDRAYQKQEEDFGRDRLAEIQELNTARCPMVEERCFVEMASHQQVLDLVRDLIGDYVVLHLQNGIINRPEVSHHQSSWHRDLPHQNYVSSRPLAVSAFWILDPFNEKTGGTQVLPFSHREERLPTVEFIEQHRKQVTAEPGSVLLFDSMLFHRAGVNTSEIVRRGVNHVYTIPLIRQQIRIPTALGPLGDPELERLLGFDVQEAESVADYRQARWLRDHGDS